MPANALCFGNDVMYIHFIVPQRRIVKYIQTGKQKNTSLLAARICSWEQPYCDCEYLSKM